MSLLQIQFILAGLCFGAWPLFMNKSGLSGILSSLTITVIIVILTLPLALGEFKNITNANWVMISIAGFFATAGMIFFNKGLFRATPENISQLVIIMAIIQIAVPAIYKIVISGVTLKQIFGFMTAIITIILLN